MYIHYSLFNYNYYAGSENDHEYRDGNDKTTNHVTDDENSKPTNKTEQVSICTLAFFSWGLCLL